MKKTSVTLLSVALWASACGGMEPADQTAGESHSKELTATDLGGQNSVVVRVSSRDPGALAVYGPDSFTLVPFTATDVAADGLAAVPAQEGKPTVEGALSSGEAEGPVSVKVLSERLAEGVSGYRLVDNTQPTYRDPFAVVYRETSYDCASVTRVSNFNKVYVSIESQQASGDPWTTVAYEVELSDNESLDACDAGTYKVRARVERRNANDYVFFGHN